METKNKKKHILDIAEELFCNYGSKDTTVRLIAQKADINTAMLNYYFNSKENLFLIVFESKINQFKEAEKKLDLQHKTTAEKLSIYIDFFIDLVIDNLPFFKLIMKEKLSNENDKIVTLIDSYFKSNRQILKNILNRNSTQTKIDIDDFIMIISGFLIFVIFKIDSSDVSNEKNKIEMKKDLGKVLRGFAFD